MVLEIGCSCIYFIEDCLKTLESFINTTAANNHILLDGLLLEVKIKESLEKAQVPEDVFDERY